MDWFTFTSNLVDSLAWPIVLVVVILILKKPITNLIDRITRIAGKDISVDFSKELSRLTQKVDRNLATKDLYDFIVNGEEIQKYFADAYIDSRSAIINGWLMIEEALRDLAKSSQLDLKHYEPSVKVLSILRNRNILPNDMYKTINEARRLRNEAIHSMDFDISPDDAQNYVSMANKISSYLRSID